MSDTSKPARASDWHSFVKNPSIEGVVHGTVSVADPDSVRCSSPEPQSRSRDSSVLGPRLGRPGGKEGCRWGDGMSLRASEKPTIDLDDGILDRFL